MVLRPVAGEIRRAAVEGCFSLSVTAPGMGRYEATIVVPQLDKVLLHVGLGSTNGAAGGKTHAPRPFGQTRAGDRVGRGRSSCRVPDQVRWRRERKP
jgi:hypothetical protein